jgi:DNA polymerase III subunit epsilon
MSGYGVVFDVETTGLDYAKDEIIEISYITFLLDPKPRIKLARSFLAENSSPLSDEIRQITGLDDELLKGETIPWNEIDHVFKNAHIVIAHNAAFDIRFLRKYLPGFKAKFACSLKHIDWESKNKKSRDLISLAAHHGFLNPFPHRALFDTATLFRIVADYIPEISQRSQYQYFKIAAVAAPYDKKDLLKQRRYRWDADAKVWWRIVDETIMEAEMAFLKESIYVANAVCPAKIDKIDLCEDQL